MSRLPAGRNGVRRVPLAHTLAGRLALGTVAWIGLWALTLLLAFNLLLSNVLGGQVDAALRARAEAVAASIQVHDGTLRIATDDDEALDAGTSVYLGRTLLEGGDLGPDLTGELVQHGRRSTDREVLGPVRYLATPIMSRHRQIGTIVVSSDIETRNRTQWIVGFTSVAVIVLILVFTFFALRATIGRAMRPVRVMADQASAWSDKDIDRRFDPDAGPLELRRLALTLNALLERIAATLRHERRFTAELSHELRTPLAHLHAEVDLLAGSAREGTGPEPVRPESLEDLLTSIRRLEGMVESALAPARVQPNGTPGLTLISDVLADLPRPATRSDLSVPSLSITGRTGLVLAVEGDVVRRALLPVLENAWRYAVHDVSIDVGAGDGLAWIAVTDDGGRLDPAHAEAVFEPGFRADPGDGHPGAGLGLALTRRICRSTGGDATATLRDGRTTVTLHLPYLLRP